MSKIRKAHSVELIERRLKDAESSVVDPLELAGLHDELARLERKWREQIATGSDRRQAGDPGRLDEWFARLQRQVDAALRRADVPADVAALLRQASTAIVGREIS